MENKPITKKWQEKEIYFLEKEEKVYIDTSEPVEIGDELRKTILDLEEQEEYLLYRIEEVKLARYSLIDSLLEYEADESKLINEFNN